MVFNIKMKNSMEKLEKCINKISLENEMGNFSYII